MVAIWRSLFTQLIAFSGFHPAVYITLQLKEHIKVTSITSDPYRWILSQKYSACTITPTLQRITKRPTRFQHTVRYWIFCKYQDDINISQKSKIKYLLKKFKLKFQHDDDDDSPVTVLLYVFHSAVQQHSFDATSSDNCIWGCFTRCCNMGTGWWHSLQSTPCLQHGSGEFLFQRCFTARP